MNAYTVTLEILVVAKNTEDAADRFWDIVDEDHRALSISVIKIKRGR